MHSEFDLIARYFTPATPDPESGVVMGVGDDCALLAPTPGRRLAVSVDTSVCGVHFPPDAPPEAVGHRALAVSLSDLAAMGARARWCFMSLSLEESEDAWLEGFSRGFLALCEATGTRLAGGDITRGELAIGVTVMGEVAPDAAMTRGGGRPGHLLAVTGALGGGAGGLAAWQAGERDPAHPLLRRYLMPQPRLAAGEALAGLATAAVDISDGLLADLGHILEHSGGGAHLEPETLPLAEGLVAALGEEGARQAALVGGDDYELLVCLPAERLDEARQRLAALALPLTVVGHLTQSPGVSGVPAARRTGWQHFRGAPPGGTS
ncbi:thiamine-phosphate kinase [Halomonas sp. SSL-5]|uniref:thiamine-phosphate kinase n=1 Tax=Halomonas sp. SSL-5 TaxID=3065855 RepID=UPI00273A030A|nr:thiamine-phosphate kinase [Halomonas sp. SSL-5]MDY7116791.1 thiamine-phosphate kinase [Halomonas sp. SSL-5]